jgi:mRNA-degrading endonuclease RelE of RelBE toxin-antitoxin system
MKIKAYERFKKAYQKLPQGVQNKINKQVVLLAEDFRHPSLHTKKIKGSKGIWEIRVDIHYRITFETIGDTIYLRVVGNHDEVLKKP